MKKLLATFLALIMVLTTGVSVFAATGANAANSIEITAFDTLEGLSATVTLATDVVSAKLFVDGAEVTAITADGSESYMVAVPAATAVKKIGKSIVSLECYNAESAKIDEIAVSAESKFLKTGENCGTFTASGVNASGKSLPISNANTHGLASNVVYDADKDALKVTLGKNAIKSNLPFFYLLANVNLPTYIEQIKDNSIVEVTFDYMATTDEATFCLETYYYTQQRENTEGQSINYAIGLAASRPGYTNVGEETSSANKWYEIKAVYNSYTKIATVYKKDLSVANAEYTMLSSGAFSPNATWGEMRGLDHIRFVMSQAATEIDTEIYVKDISVTRSRELLAGEIMSSISYTGTAKEVTDSKISTLDKAVIASTENLAGITAEKVKLYKDGAEILAENYALDIDAENSTLKVTPNAGFAAGNYKIVLDSSVTYHNVGAIGVPYEISFDAVKEFAILSPANGDSAQLGEIKVYVSDNKCASVSLYANGALVATKNATDIEGQYVFSYTPSVIGEVTLDAVATYANGSTETKTVTINVDGLFNNYFDGSLTLNKKTNADVFTMSDIADDTIPAPADSRITKSARKLVLKESPAMGTDSTSDSSSLTKNIGEMNYPTGMRNTTGIVTYGFDVYFDDAANTQLGLTGLVGKLGVNSGLWFPRTLGVDDLSLEPLFNKGTITSTGVTYGSDTWYRFEFVVDMRNGDHSGYMTNLSTGVKTTLAEGLKATVNGKAIAGEYYFRTFAVNARMTKNAAVGTELYIANAYISSSEEIPAITGVNAEGNDVISAAASADIILSGNLYDNLEGAVTVTDGKGNPVELESVVYSKENKKITITPVGGFSAYNTYNVNIGATAKAYYYVGAANDTSEKEVGVSQSVKIKVADDKGLYYEISKDGANVKFAYNNAGDAKAAILIIASYSTDGSKLEEVCVSTENTMFAGEGTFIAKMPVGGNKVSLMLWDSLTGLQPIINDVDITSLR